MRWLTNSILTIAIAVLVVALFADDADAQRRRRRRQPVSEQVDAGTPPPATPAEGVPEADFGAPAAGEGPAAQIPSEDATAQAAAPAETAPVTEFDPGPPPPDVSPIRADYVALMDDLVQARMRVHALGSELFRTRIRIDLQDRTQNNVVLSRIVVHLDGAPVFQSDAPVEGSDQGREIFTGSLAPGPHVLTLEVEQRAREDDAYRYSLRESYRFQVVRERLSEVTLVLEDGSDMARSFPSGGEGRYEVRTRMRVATRALPSNG